MNKAVKAMANINWSRHSYTSRLDRDYYTSPTQGFDRAWHDTNRKKRKAQAEAKLKAARATIKAMRTNKTQG